MHSRCTKDTPKPQLLLVIAFISCNMKTNGVMNFTCTISTLKILTEILDWNNVLPVTKFIYFSALMSLNVLALLYLAYLPKLNNERYNFLWRLWRFLAIVTESFSPIKLNYTTYFVKVRIRSEVTSHTIPDAVYLPSALNWAKLVRTGHSKPKQMLM